MSVIRDGYKLSVIIGSASTTTFFKAKETLSPEKSTPCAHFERTDRHILTLLCSGKIRLALFPPPCKSECRGSRCRLPRSAWKLGQRVSHRESGMNSMRGIVLGMAVFACQVSVNAGDIFRLHGFGKGCDCHGSAPAPAVVYSAPVVQAAPVLEAGCLCGAALPTCCAGGVANAGLIHGLGGAGYAHSVHGGQFGGPAPGSFLSGFEGIPNMDGGGVHHRYPYHSYRRPWAHPGPPSNNITIVW
jgi:hypothetical protein